VGTSNSEKTFELKDLVGKKLVRFTVDGSDGGSFHLVFEDGIIMHIQYDAYGGAMWINDTEEV
jgi:hypothetical protein